MESWAWRNVRSSLRLGMTYLRRRGCSGAGPYLAGWGGGAGRGDSCPQRFDKVTITLLEVSSLSPPPPPPPPVIRENTSALTSCSKIARYGAVEALENIRFLLGVRLGTVWGKSAMTDLVAREAGLAEFFRHQLASNHVIPAQVR